MIIYHTVSTYHMLKSMLHKLNYHHDSEAILLVPAIFPKLPYGLKYKNNDIFSKIIFYDWEYKRFNNYPADVFARIEKVLNENICNNWECLTEEINVFNAARFFGSYLAYNNISFNWFEEADGRFTNPCPPMKDDERMYPERFQLADSLGMYTAENECIQKIFICSRAQTVINEDSRAVEFDVPEELEKLSTEDRKKVMSFWGAPTNKLQIKRNSALLLSQHFCNVKLISMEEQILLYQMTADYFLDGYKIYIKMHPSDLVPYKNYLNDVEILNADFPSELLPYTINTNFELVAAISSTGVMNLKNISNDQLIINEDYIHGFWENDRYYFVCKVLEYFPDYRVIACGVNEAQLEVMWKFGLKNEIRHITYMSLINENDLEDHTIVILGENIQESAISCLNQCQNEDILIAFTKFIGLNEELSLLKNEAFFMSVKEIHISEIDACKSSTCESVKQIFLLSDREDNIMKIDSMHYEKLLLNTGTKTRVDENWNKDAQIAALTGMLKATEATLKQYLIENKKLKEQIENRSL